MITFSREFASEISAQGEKTYPNECCGVLLGLFDSKLVTEILPIDNSFEDNERYHRFKIEPEDYMRAEKYARARGTDILGFYHSHPDHPAEPSEYDREFALPFYSYVIVPVSGGKAGNMTSWVLSGDRSGYNEENVIIGE